METTANLRMGTADMRITITPADHDEEFCEVCEEERWTEIVLIPDAGLAATVCSACAEGGIEDRACLPVEDKVVRYRPQGS
jgi:hypothetical protein